MSELTLDYRTVPMVPRRSRSPETNRVAPSVADSLACAMLSEAPLADLDWQTCERPRLERTGRLSALRLSWSSAVEHWRSVRRLRSSIAHLDDRLLADVGFSQRDLGFAERFVRATVAGGSMWTRTDV
jgi:uncharacterized protein YjiS (DUF1127 family)